MLVMTLVVLTHRRFNMRPVSLDAFSLRIDWIATPGLYPDTALRAGTEETRLRLTLSSVRSMTRPRTPRASTDVLHQLAARILKALRPRPF